MKGGLKRRYFRFVSVTENAACYFFKIYSHDLNVIFDVRHEKIVECVAILACIKGRIVLFGGKVGSRDLKDLGKVQKSMLKSEGFS